MSVHDVGHVREFAEGVPQQVRVNGWTLIVVRWQRAFYALRSVCPHQLQSLAGGLVRAGIGQSASVGEVTVEKEGGVIACPVHGWEFDLVNGRCRHDPTLRVKSYPVSVKHDRVLVTRPGR
jgi:nitrite reductase/ring-hydroxylating ferredoxin subunit